LELPAADFRIRLTNRRKEKLGEVMLGKHMRGEVPERLNGAVSKFRNRNYDQFRAVTEASVATL